MFVKHQLPWICNWSTGRLIHRSSTILCKFSIIKKCPYLKHSHNSPEQRVKVLPVRHGISSLSLQTELAAKYMHPQDTAQADNKVIFSSYFPIDFNSTGFICMTASTTAIISKQLSENVGTAPNVHWRDKPCQTNNEKEDPDQNSKVKRKNLLKIWGRNTNRNQDSESLVWLYYFQKQHKRSCGI